MTEGLCTGANLAVQKCAALCFAAKRRAVRVDGLIEDGEKKIGVGGGNVHRQSVADGLAPKPAFVEEETELVGVFDDVSARHFVGRFRRTVLNKFDAVRKGLAADIADDGIFSFQLVKAREKGEDEAEAVFLGFFCAMTSSTALLIA